MTNRMAEKLQSAVFKKIVEDLQEFCDTNQKITDALKSVDANKDDVVDKTYETLEASLCNSEKVLCEIVAYVKTNKLLWAELKRNKQSLLNGGVETNEIATSETDENNELKVGLLKLVSLDKLLDPKRFNEPSNEDDAVIVLSDSETAAATSTQNNKNAKQVNNSSSRIKIRPLRSRNNRKSYKLSDGESSGDDDESRTNKRKRGRRKNSDSSASDPEFVVAKKTKAVADGGGGSGAKKVTDVASGKKVIEGVESKTSVEVDKKVYVALPRVECEKLKEYYLKKPEVFLPKARKRLLIEHSYTKQREKHKQNKNSEREKITLKSILTANSGDCVELNMRDFMRKKPNSFKKNETDEEQQNKSTTPDCLENRNSTPTANGENSKNSDDDETANNTEENLRKQPEKSVEKDKIIDRDVSRRRKEKTKDDNNSSEINEGGEKTNNITPNEVVVENQNTDENLSNQSADETRKNDETIDGNQSADETLENDETIDGEQSSDERKCDVGESLRDQLLEQVEEEIIDCIKSEDESSEKQKKDSNDESPQKRVRFESDEDYDKQKNSSDSEDFDFAKFNSKKDKEKRGKSKKKKVLSSDSENELDEIVNEPSASSPQAASSASEQEDEEEELSKEEKRKGRRRIKRVRDSSSEGEAASDRDKATENSTRRHLKKIIANSRLSETTKQAEKEERERKARILEKQKKYNQIFDEDALKKSTVDKIVLDFDETTKKELLTVHRDLVKHLKPHQASGIKFMWDACFESLERARKIGSGCILAHCMGLGKTLQVITLCHTLLTNSDRCGVEKVLVVCPLNTVLNWVAEFKQWLPKSSNFEVFEIVSHKQNSGRHFIVKEWFREGGVLILGYDMFRNLSNDKNKRLTKKMRNDFLKALVDPGPDVVVCDEGHLLKNEKTTLSIAMNRMKTLRRIVLTGTPLQNNLKEYYCMVQFVKPNLLGTYKEYLNRFVNPITNGQYTDSTPMDIHIMRKRSHVLHKLLDGVVQRRDYCVLEPYLPPKYEYVLFLSLTAKQIEVYRYYMNNAARNQNFQTSKGKASFLFADFQEFQRICTHPKVLQDKSLENREKREKIDDSEEDSEGSLKDFIDDGDEDEAKSTSSNSSSGSESDASIRSNRDTTRKKKTRVTRAAAAAAGGIDEIIKNQVEETRSVEWWEQFLTEEDLENIHLSSKLFLLFEILAQCEAIGDKILVFSQSLYSLNVIEYFLQKIDEATQNNKTCCGFTGSWALGLDYFRIDGSSSCDNRAAWCRSFNNPENHRSRLFLISTRAGGLGINLVAANRVIIFDVSWNPSHDTQSIYRVYRFGQTKPCYIYRFVTLGTMEMKVYERQVTKQAISKRVIDEQQIDRHYTQTDLLELYRFEPTPEGERPTPLVPKDVLLGELLQQFPDRIYKYHEHQSLLENKVDEVLDEEERKAAWEEFENEKTTRSFTTGYWMGIPMERATTAIRRIIQREMPDIDLRELNLAILARMKQIEAEVKLSNTENYAKVIAEINQIQAEQQQKFREHYLQQQAMKMMQQQFALAGQADYFNALQNLRNQQRPPGVVNVGGGGGGGRSGVYVYNTQQQQQQLQQQQQQNAVPTEIVELND